MDAKSLLEAMIRSAAPDARQSQSAGGGLGDLIGELLGGGTPASSQAPTSRGQDPGMGALGDLLKQFTGGDTTSRGHTSPGEQGGALSDLLRNMLPPQANIPGGGATAPAAGGLLEILGQILGQATAGVKEGAQKADDATGMSDQLRDLLTRTTGKSPEELMNTAKELIEKNKLGAGVAAGGLGTLVLGTETGRALAGSALKLGALALIGGLAYKAVQNYQAGKPLVDGSTSALVAAPSGSGYEARAVTNEAALLYIRAMIAAAAADGRVDAKEQANIIGGLRQAGIDHEAEEFLANELNNPATTAQLAGAVTNEAEAVQVFTAARIAIDLDSAEEHDFLVALANDLGIDGELAAHIDATARQAA